MSALETAESLRYPRLCWDIFGIHKVILSTLLPCAIGKSAGPMTINPCCDIILSYIPEESTMPDVDVKDEKDHVLL